MIVLPFSDAWGGITTDDTTCSIWATGKNESPYITPKLKCPYRHLFPAGRFIGEI